MKGKLQTAAVRVLTSERLRSARRGVAEARRRVMGGAHTVTYYHRVDDPYAHLLVQALSRFLDAQDVDFRHRLVPAPEADTAPEPELLEAWSLADSVELARYYNVDLDAGARQPSDALTARAGAILAAIGDSRDFVAAAAEVGRALWAGDDKALAALGAKHGTVDEGALAQALAEGGAELTERGHYFGATLHYAGEWYWGIERLAYLEERLAALGLARPGAPEHGIALRPEAELPADGLGGPDAEVALDFYISFRSPYTYLAMQRVLDLAERYPLRLNVKPVLPMLMRGLPVPRRKALYILGDAAREARRLGLPFGNWADPLGPGVERCMALFPYAEREGKVVAYLRSIYDGVWTEALDSATPKGLRTMVERAGLDWAVAEPLLGEESWREWAERNRAELAEAGHWGVPSFVLGPYAAWGQDRIWILERKLKAHFG